MRNLRAKWLGAVLISTLVQISFAADQVSTVPRHTKFEYEMSDEGVRKIEAGVKALKKGDPLKVVISNLGKPTSIKILYTKKLFGRGEFVSKDVVYILKQVRLNDYNLNDHAISLHFDKNERLIEAERLGYAVTGTYEILGGMQVVEKIPLN